MNKLTFALAAALLLCGTADAVHFQRPWENRTWVATNPNIWSYGFEIWYGVDNLHGTLRSMDLEDADMLPSAGQSPAYITTARNMSLKAEDDRHACADDLVAEGILISTPLTYTIGMIQIFSSIHSCISYRSDWIGTVQPALLALESSIAEADKSILGARSSYSGLVRSGLCDDNYTLAGSGRCGKMRDAFNSLDNNITEGAYGRYPLLMNFSRRIRIGLAQPEPDLSLFSSSMALVWGDGGCIKTFDQISADAVLAQDEAESEYRSRLQDSKNLGRRAQENIGLLESEDLDLIDRAAASTQTHGFGSVSERLHALDERMGSLLMQSEAAVSYHDSGKAGYISSPIMSLYASNSALDGLISDSSILLDDARTCEIQQKEEAESELAKTGAWIAKGAGSAQAAQTLEEAKTHLARGESYETVGMRFAEYSKAAALARAARSSGGFEMQAAKEGRMSELESLIKRAEADGINVISEKSDLAMLKGMADYDISDYIERDISGILSKAEIKYDDEIRSKRAAIYEKLSLAGPSASDLRTDLDRYEDGIFIRSCGSCPISDDRIEYIDAIGKLKGLESDYSALEDTLDMYMAEIVGNSMSIDAAPLIGEVELDRPAAIAVDAVLVNGHPYGADGATASIRLPSGDWPDFTYPDITIGKEDVQSLRMSDDGTAIAVVFPRVEPYESRRVALEKNKTIARTTNLETAAEGIGDGRALVKGELEFVCDLDIPSLSSLDGFGEATIDGGPAEGPILAGNHILSYENTVEDAYTEDIRDINAYRIGTRSQVEYFIDILPEIDMERALVFIDIINQSNVSSFEAVASTGEQVDDKRRISATQYSVRINGLRKGELSTIRIGYQVDDTASFVKEQIGQMETANLSQTARDYLRYARSQMDHGNFTLALEYLEKARSAAKEDGISDSKLQSRLETLKETAAKELLVLDSILEKANSTDPGWAFIDRIRTRRDEVSRALSASNQSNLTDSVSMMERIDFDWLKKEIASLRKDSYKSYNDLKARFSDSGNSSMPRSFTRFEGALNRLDTSNDPLYAIDMLAALDDAEKDVGASEGAKIRSISEQGATLERVRTDVRMVMDRYLSESGSAKGSSYESVFDLAEKDVEKQLSDAESALSKDPRIFNLRLDDIERSRKKMLSTLALLRNESQTKLSILERAIDGKAPDDSANGSVSEKIAAVRDMIADGRYINALRAMDSISKALDAQNKKSDSPLLLLGISCAAILALAAVYIITHKKDFGLGRFGALERLLGGKPKKAFRKLERAGDPPGSEDPPPP